MRPFMPRFLTLICSFALLVGAERASLAFSLLGPIDTRYQVVEIAHNLPGDVGGVMNLGDEYRWNLPVITYGYDKTFFDYFGAQGIEAVEKAIKILNDLGPISSWSADLSEFPIEGAKRINYRAAALGIRDLKSMSLGVLLEQLGVASSHRFTWTLRDRRVIQNIPQYLVIQRNFDPITWVYSPYINETLYTYRITQTFVNPDVYDAIEVPVDPLVAALRSPVSGIMGDVDIGGVLGAGEFFTGITRDDAGALRYLYRGLNVNAENFAPGSVFSLTFNTNNPSGGNSGGAGGPIVIGTGERSPWDDPFGFTNLSFTNLVVGTNANLTNVGGGGGPVVTPVAVDAALRPGIDKITFVRVFPESTVGGLFLFTNSYVDVFITNGVLLQQPVERVLTRPDILFIADDIGLNAGGVPVILSRSLGFDNNRDLNSSSAQGGQQAGPGVILPGSEVTFNKLGPYKFNDDFPPFLSGSDLTEFGSGTFAFGALWGHFDGSTNAPILFPTGTSIRQLEEAVLGGKVGGF
jgi:hypothetical protein